MVRRALTGAAVALGALSVAACGGQSGSIPSSGEREPAYAFQAGESRPMSLQFGGITAPTRETVLYSFGGSHGAKPAASLINVDGVLYGTTQNGGTNGLGTVFKITTSGMESVVHNFGGAGDGDVPTASLLDINGVLYGTTTGGGAHNDGTVFKITPSGTESVIYSFAGGSDGVGPSANLTDVDGVLYGTTLSGGANGNGGTVFRITTSGMETVLHSFGGGRDGANPTAGLTNVDGVLYGTTEIGGANGVGTVFKITVSGAETVLHSFGDGTGKEPLGGLTNVNGVLYGTTEGGGTNDCGTVFKITTSGVESVIYRFASGSDGCGPEAALIEVNGALYGTTYAGGDSSGTGTVFKITTSGLENVLYHFEGGTAGENPAAGVTNLNGVLYGTTVFGGAHGKGIVFSSPL